MLHITENKLEHKLGQFKFVQKLNCSTNVIVMQDDSKRLWAAKHLDLNNPDSVRMCQQEASILEYLNNLNVSCVPRCLGIVDNVNSSCVVTEYFADFVTWRQFLLVTNFLPENDLVEICYALENALDELHINGVAHYDLHSENILVNSKRRQVKIIDFGISKMMGTREDMQFDYHMIDNRFQDLLIAASHTIMPKLQHIFTLFKNKLTI